jgi:hypothetical protein
MSIIFSHSILTALNYIDVYSAGPLHAAQSLITPCCLVHTIPVANKHCQVYSEGISAPAPAHAHSGAVKNYKLETKFK